MNCVGFVVTNEELAHLQKELGKYVNFAAWSFLKRNNRNGHDFEYADVEQELTQAMLEAGIYFKRQTYIENSLQKCTEFVKTNFLQLLAIELQLVWELRRKHRAGKQRFGLYQENMLEKLLHIVPEQERPLKTAQLEINDKFRRYCKTIIWNRLKNIGKKITKNRSFRMGAVSLSQFEYIGELVN